MEKNSWMLFKQDICKLLRIILYFLLFPHHIFFSWPSKYSKTKTIDDKNDPMDYIIKFICFLPLTIFIITTIVFLLVDYFKLKTINIYQWKYIFIWLIPCFFVQGICHLILLKLGKMNKRKWLQRYYNFWTNQKSRKLSNQLASGRLMTEKESNNIFTTMLWNKNNILVSNNENHNDIGFIVNTKLKQKNSILEYKITKDIGHSLLIGSTRSGKTSLIINTQIQMFAKSSIQPTMIITDPKGELYKLHSANLKAQGYQIFKLDSRSENSDFWNPLEEVWHQWEVRNPNQKADIDLENVRNRAQDKIVKIIDMIIPQSNDSIWSNGAKKILEGIILAMLEQAEWDQNITLDKFNFANIQYNLNSTTYENLNNYLDSIETKSKELNYLSRVIEVCWSTIRGAQKTTEGIIQQLTSSLIVFAQSKIKNITAKTTIKFDNTKPQAIFIIFPDEEKSTYDFTSLFITETYSKLINDLDKSNLAKYHRPIYYILD